MHISIYFDEGRSEKDVPRSLMLNTPEAAAELCLRFAALSSLGGLDDKPWTAESTLERGAGAASADMIDSFVRRSKLNGSSKFNWMKTNTGGTKVRRYLYVHDQKIVRYQAGDLIALVSWDWTCGWLMGCLMERDQVRCRWKKRKRGMRRDPSQTAAKVSWGAGYWAHVIIRRVTLNIAWELMEIAYWGAKPNKVVYGLHFWSFPRKLRKVNLGKCAREMTSLGAEKMGWITFGFQDYEEDL